MDQGNIDVRIGVLEQRQLAVESDVKEIKIQLHDTVKKADLLNLETKLDERDRHYINKLWQLVFALIVVFTGIIIASVGMRVSDLPNLFM
jgi:hypothetical protein